MSDFLMKTSPKTFIHEILLSAKSSTNMLHSTPVLCPFVYCAACFSQGRHRKVDWGGLSTQHRKRFLR